MPPTSGLMSMLRRSISSSTSSNQDMEQPQNPVAPNGMNHSKKIQMSGWLKKQSETLKAWRRRYFTLSGTMLTYYDSENTNTSSPKGVMRITDVLPLTSNEKGLLLQLSNGKTVKLVADTKIVYNAWFSVISVNLQKGKADSPNAGKSGWTHYHNEEGKWTRYYIVLNEDTISSYSNSESDATLELSGIVRSVAIWEGKKCGLIIGINKKRRMQVCFDTIEERNTWMLTLEMALNFASNSQDHESRRHIVKTGRMTEPPRNHRRTSTRNKLERKTDPANPGSLSPSKDNSRNNTDVACGVWI